jgi:2-amino-4-hydroxy-6-hydroxymethyldihydropteridine diphosphokinase
MILIAVGANLPSALGPPRAACEAAYARLEERGLRLLRRSPFYETAPVPVSDQPWYVNGVAVAETRLPPADLLALLHEVEAEMGRLRGLPNAPRVIDLDLLAYDEEVVTSGALTLPHPRLHLRAFVLLPLRDVAADWRHPASGAGLAEMIAALPADQVARRLT